MEKEQRFCQSYGMPLADVNDIGTNADGSRNEDYCKYCYKNGQFTQQCTILQRFLSPQLCDITIENRL